MNNRAFPLLALILCVAGSGFCQTAPKLPQQFTSNYTIVFPDFTSPVYINGFLALDFVHGGAFLDIGREEFVPLSFHTNLVASPDNQGSVNGYMFEGPLCWNMGSIPIWFVAAFPFQIPANSTFLGNKVVLGQSCTGWNFVANVFDVVMPVTVWVSTGPGNNVVQVQVDNVEYVNTVVINFFNTAVGPLSPYVYAPPTKTNPNITCTQAWTGNPVTAFFRK